MKFFQDQRKTPACYTSSNKCIPAFLFFIRTFLPAPVMPLHGGTLFSILFAAAEYSATVPHLSVIALQKQEEFVDRQRNYTMQGMRNWNKRKGHKCDNIYPCK